MMRINSKLLEIEQHGEGEAMIMVHGLGGTANAWYPQASLLARSFHVIRPDMEGSGRSPAKGKISIASLAKDVSKLMDKLNIRSAHFLGHSMGAIVCQHIAAGNPARVKSLALLGPLAEPPQPARGARKELLARDNDSTTRPPRRDLANKCQRRRSKQKDLQVNMARTNIRRAVAISRYS